MKDYVVYTVLTGGYDNITQPLVVDDRFDYILFTDKVCQPKIGVWEVRLFESCCTDSTRNSRYPKMLPHVCLPNYKYWFYHDANIQISNKNVYEKIIALSQQSVDWAGLLHPRRDCIFEEAFVIIKDGLDTDINVLRICHRLSRDGFPTHYGMYENGCIYRKNNSIVNEIDEQWWRLYLKYTRRDQLLLSYLFWLYPQVQRTFLFPDCQDVRKYDAFNYTFHSPKNRHVHINRSLCSLRCHYINRNQNKENQIKLWYNFLYRCPYRIAKLLLFCWSIWIGIDKLLKR